MVFGILRNILPKYYMSAEQPFLHITSLQWEQVSFPTKGTAEACSVNPHPQLAPHIWLLEGTQCRGGGQRSCGLGKFTQQPCTPSYFSHPEDDAFPNHPSSNVLSLANASAQAGHTCSSLLAFTTHVPKELQHLCHFTQSSSNAAWLSRTLNHLANGPYTHTQKKKNLDILQEILQENTKLLC